MPLGDLVFFLSGLAALAHESIWARLLVRVLGSDASAVSVVLATYMAGLGLGARLWARRAERGARLQFAGLECAIALWAMGSPWILARIDPVDGLFARSLVAGLVLLPPTIAMGATFPVMGRLSIARREEAGAAVSGFYGANTLGAAVGALVAPALLMPAFGLPGGLVASGSIGLLAAGLSLGLREPERPAPAAAAAVRGAERSGPAAPWLAATFLMGASALALEVLLTRVLVTVTGASVYAFAIVLAVFLFGIGLGSRQIAPRLARARDPGGPKGAGTAEAAVFATALLVPTATALGALALRWQLGEADLFGGLANRLPDVGSTWTLWASHALFAGLALLPPAVLFGMALPATAAALVTRERAAPERALGRTYAANTAGALVGSVAAGSLLLPQLGPRLGLATALLLPLVAAALVARARARAAPPERSEPGTSEPGRPDRSLAWLALGTVLAGGTTWAALAPRPRDDGVLHIATAVGQHATATVEERAVAGGSRVRALRVNGKVVATSAPVDLRLQRLLGLVPATLSGDVERALVIGMGTGMTAGALLGLPELERLDVYEISTAVVRVAPAFAEWNGDLLDDPRTHLAIVDGRHALLRSEERWDLITADPIHPWTRGSSDLYALEHFCAIRDHLAPGGVASQWLPLYQLSTEDVRTVIATWVTAFPHSTAWLTAYDLALVGALEPTALEAPLGTFPPAVARDLAEAGVHGPLELAALQVADAARLEAFRAGVPPMREARPVLEFRAPRSYLGGYSVEALRWAADPAFAATLPEAARPRAAEARELLLDFLDELPTGLAAAAERYGQRLLELPPLAPDESAPR